MERSVADHIVRGHLEQAQEYIERGMAVRESSLISANDRRDLQLARDVIARLRQKIAGGKRKRAAVSR